MKLRTRLTAAVVAVSSAGTLLIGGVSISDVRTSKLAAVDQTLFAVTGQADATKSDQVGAALFAADQSSIAVAVGFAAPGSGFTWLRDLPRLRQAALSAPQTAQGYRMASVRLKNGEIVVVAASVKDIDSQTTSDIVSLATFWLVLSLFMGLLIRILVRRDVAQIERLVVAAARIAEGAESVEIPEQASSAEVTTLAQALRRTVASLRATVEFEQATTQRMQQFLGDASHELRTPLTVIRGYLELLERDVPLEQRERALLRMRSEAKRMEALVNDLLLLAEIGTPLPEVFEVLDLTALVRVFIDDLREL
ncbi:MAG: histidine kinase dimerization/phospho-acceptor domain-containing protein, partial [Candidatus Nanopelagicales bacterium]